MALGIRLHVIEKEGWAKSWAHFDCGYDGWELYNFAETNGVKLERNLHFHYEELDHDLWKNGLYCLPCNYVADYYERALIERNDNEFWDQRIRAMVPYLRSMDDTCMVVIYGS